MGAKLFISGVLAAGLLLTAFVDHGTAQQAPGKLPAAELRRLASAHNAPADHLQLAAHYRAVAAEHEADAKEHEALAAEYEKDLTAKGRAQKHPMSPATVEHCKFYAQHCRNLAKEALAMAAEHDAMAKQPAH